MQNYHFNKDNVRLNLLQDDATSTYDWVFIPGGPGADSRYFNSLLQHLKLPGKIWLIDLPENGDNRADENYNFDTWTTIFPDLIRQFAKPILVGHSFGGMFPLLFSEFEDILAGFIIFNSAPSLWLEEAVNYAKRFDLPDLSQDMQMFRLNPCQETFNKALAACMPYYFPKETLETGWSLLKAIPFNYRAAVWWQQKVVKMPFEARWIPQKVKTLIINGEYDAICPYTLFEKDTRFHRDNIKRILLPKAGHMAWIDKPQDVAKLFSEFME